MKDIYKTKKQLIEELEALRQQVTELKKAETKQKQAEKVFRENEARLRTVIESIPFDIFMIDATGHYVLQNSTCRKNWGMLLENALKMLHRIRRCWHYGTVTIEEHLQGKL